MATFILLSDEGKEEGPILDEDGNGNEISNSQVLGYARYGDGPAWEISQREGITYQLIVRRAFKAWKSSEEGIAARDNGFDEVRIQELQYDSYDDLQQLEWLKS